jgi:hypothetical protein
VNFLSSAEGRKRAHTERIRLFPDFSNAYSGLCVSNAWKMRNGSQLGQFETESDPHRGILDSSKYRSIFGATKAVSLRGAQRVFCLCPISSKPTSGRSAGLRDICSDAVGKWPRVRRGNSAHKFPLARTTPQDQRCIGQAEGVRRRGIKSLRLQRAFPSNDDNDSTATRRMIH